MSNYFTELASVDVSAHVEKKAGFSYLSWPFAVAELRKRHPTATWRVVKNDGLPFIATGAGVFVEVEVTVDGVSLSQIHPVLDNRNRPIDTPNSFQINTSIQRCLVKAIALHGLGLGLYAGEDLPLEGRQSDVKRISAVQGAPGEVLDAEVEQYLLEVADNLTRGVSAGKSKEARQWLDEQGLDDQQYTFLWANLDSKIRAALDGQRKKAA